LFETPYFCKDHISRHLELAKPLEGHPAVEHFRALARGRMAQLGDDLLQKVDIVISEVTACTASTHACIAAIVGLRQTLYPDAPAYQPRQTGLADAAQSGPGEAASVGSVS